MQSRRVFATITVVAICSAFFALTPTRHSINRSASATDSPRPPPEPQLEAAVPKRRRPKNDLVVGGVGDLMAMMGIYRPLVKRGGFHTLIDGVAHVWREWAHVTIANLEMVVSDIDVWGTEHARTESTKQRFLSNESIFTAGMKVGFNLPFELLADVVEAGGFELLATANNHALERGLLGVTRTVQNLKKLGVTAVGTRETPGNESDPRQWFVVKEHNGWNVAWLSCTNLLPAHRLQRHGEPLVRLITSKTKLGPMADKKAMRQQILSCENAAKLVRMVAQGHVDLPDAKASEIDAIIVHVHWGSENVKNKNENQVQLGRSILEAGAVAIIGHHPHILQSAEHYFTRDKRRTYIAYSLGGISGGWSTFANRIAAIVFIRLHMTELGAQVKDVKFVPTYEVPRPSVYTYAYRSMPSWDCDRFFANRSAFDRWRAPFAEVPREFDLVPYVPDEAWLEEERKKKSYRESALNKTINDRANKWRKRMEYLDERVVSKLLHECRKAHNAAVFFFGEGDLELERVEFPFPQRDAYSKFIMPPNDIFH